MNANEEKPIKVEICVSYDGGAKHGKGSNYFNNLKGLKDWCEKNPELAKVIGYELKKK